MEEEMTQQYVYTVLRDPELPEWHWREPVKGTGFLGIGRKKEPLPVNVARRILHRLERKDPPAAMTMRAELQRICNDLQRKETKSADMARQSIRALLFPKQNARAPQG